MKLFKCKVCNNMVEAESIEEACLKCGAPASEFVELTEEQAEKVYDSERTNDILMELDVLTMKIAELCYEGVEIDLDPSCVKGFTYANDKAWEIKQMVKAEIENHIAKGKW
ncbi:MAG: hypothetical protein RR543_01125 [Erysipelotrichales bacterium]